MVNESLYFQLLQLIILMKKLRIADLGLFLKVYSTIADLDIINTMLDTKKCFFFSSKIGWILNIFTLM